MRLFFAIALPEESRRSLAALRDGLRESGAKASWVKTENLHLTLRFLGEAAPPAVEEACAGIARDIASLGAFTLVLQGAGAFPSLRRPEVAWAGIQAAPPALAELWRVVDAAAVAMGAPEEKRPFHPHITLGRVRMRRGGEACMERLREALCAAQDYAGGAFEVASVSLFQSSLKPGGAVYHRLREFSLQ